MPTVAPLDPSDTLTPAPPHATITVGDLITMLQREDPDAFAYVAVPESSGESDNIELQAASGIERRFYGGRKVVVVR